MTTILPRCIKCGLRFRFLHFSGRCVQCEKEEKKA